MEKALNSARPVHAVSLRWLQESEQRWARQQEDLYSYGGGGTAEWARGAAAAEAAAQPDEVMRRALAAVASIPASLSREGRLKAALKFVVPAPQRPQILQLFSHFDAATEEGNAAGRDALMKGVVELVGYDFLQRLFVALGMQPSGSEPLG